ncbi:O-antigen ligase family protein [Celeribacter sp. ULVN23_4]
MDFDRLHPVRMRKNETNPAQDVSREVLHFDETFIPETRKTAMGPNATNAVYLRLVAVLVLVIPIPFGSNRPVLWALWGAIIAILVSAFLLRLILWETERKLQIGRVSDVLFLAMIMPLAALVQMLPIGLPVAGAMPPERVLGTISIAPRATALGMLRLMSYAGIFLLAFEVMTRPKRVRQMANILFYGLTLHAVLAMVFLTVLGDTVFGIEKTAYHGWATGTFVNRNSFASFMGLGIVIGMALFFQHLNEQGKTTRSPRAGGLGQDVLEAVWLLICVAILLTALLSSGSRMGLFATGLGVFATLVMMSRGRVLRGRSLGFALIVIVLAVGTVLFQDTGARVIWAGFDIETRLDLYRNVWGLILTRPWTGYGLDTFQIAFPLVHDARVSSQLVWDLSHNSYLMLWAELGLVAGSAILLALLMASIRMVRFARRQAQRPLGPAIGIGALTLAAVHSTLDFSFEMEANAVLLLVLVAMGLSQIRDASRMPQ